jgi:hypothetical protein
VIHAVAGAVALGALSTLGDFVWANWRVRHMMVYGIVHGIAIFLAVGLVLGARYKRPVTGALLGIVAGAAAAASFYVMRPVLGYSAMFASWLLVWIALGAINRVLWVPRHASLMARAALRDALTRGLAAAVLSGAAFYAVSGMWAPFNPQGLADYAEHFVRWTIAFLPGFAALFIGLDAARRA